MNSEVDATSGAVIAATQDRLGHAQAGFRTNFRL